MKDNKIFSLVLEPDPLLHKKSELVMDINSEVKEFSKKLVATMKYYKGLGLAAVQVGVLKKIIAVDIINIGREGDAPLNLEEGPRILINPEIIEKSSDKKVYAEGCLSFGNIFPEVERFNQIKVRYLDLDGKENLLEVSDNIMSACLQHEIDHTNGIVFLDRLSRIKKDFMMKKYLKWKKNNADS
jgi:peptide deformylase